ncbi:unnamed protein product, partial [Closterium sp. NIES-53]
SSLYTLTTASRSTPSSPQLHASAQVATQCECRRLSHDTLLWHHRLGHRSLPRLRSMHSRFLISGLPTSLPPLPPSHVPPCIPCVEGWQRAAPHSSSFPPTEAPLPLGSLLCGAWHPPDFHASGLSAAKWVAERRIGLVMEVARTSMIHAAAPHFLWPFAVWYAAHQLNLWPRVSLPETSPTLLWMGKVGDASLCPLLLPLPLPHCSSPPPPPPLFLAPGPPQVDPLPAPGPAPSGVSQVDPPAPAPVEVTGDSGPAANGAVPGGAELGGAESGGAERVEPGGAEPAREEPGGAASRGTASGGATSGACRYVVSLE